VAAAYVCSSEDVYKSVQQPRRHMLLDIVCSDTTGVLVPYHMTT